jgi:hypothetical protein
MDSATVVALTLGVGSLVVTLVLDRRNRRERVETASADRADRESRDQAERLERTEREHLAATRDLATRWVRDKREIYAKYLAAADAWDYWFGYAAMSAGSITDGEVTEAEGLPDRSGPEESGGPGLEELARSVSEMRLVAPTSVASLADADLGARRSMSWTLALLRVARDMHDQEDHRHLVESLGTESSEAAVNADRLVDAMRADIGAEPPTSSAAELAGAPQ